MELNNTTTYREAYSHYNKVSSIISASERINPIFFVIPSIFLKRFSIFVKPSNPLTRLLFGFTYLLSDNANRKEELYAF